MDIFRYTITLITAVEHDIYIGVFCHLKDSPAGVVTGTQNTYLSNQSSQVNPMQPG